MCVIMVTIVFNVFPYNTCVPKCIVCHTDYSLYPHVFMHYILLMCVPVLYISTDFIMICV